MLLYDVLSQQGGTLSLNEGLFLPKRKTKREIAIPVSLKLLLMKKTFKKRHEEQSNWWKHIGSFVKLFVFLFLFLAILGIITMFSYFSWYIELYWMKSWWNPQRSPPFFFTTTVWHTVTLRSHVDPCRCLHLRPVLADLDLKSLGFAVLRPLKPLGLERNRRRFENGTSWTQ